MSAWKRQKAVLVFFGAIVAGWVFLAAAVFLLYLVIALA